MKTAAFLLFAGVVIYGIANGIIYRRSDIMDVLSDAEYCVNYNIEREQSFNHCFPNTYQIKTGKSNYATVF